MHQQQYRDTVAQTNPSISKFHIEIMVSQRLDGSQADSPNTVA